MKRTGWQVSMCVLAVVMLLSVVGESYAQQRGGLSAEKELAAQRIEAEYVAKKLGLSDDATSKLVGAYVGSRKSLSEARQAMRSEGRRGWEAMRELTDKEAKKLGAEVAKFLNEKQVQEATESLGTFSTTWDRMVDALSGFKLEEKVLESAMGKVHEYVIESAKLMEKARESGSFDEVRSKFQELRDKLNKEMEGMLTKEQIEKWAEMTERRGRRQ